MNCGRKREPSRAGDMSKAATGILEVRVHPKLLGSASRVLRQLGVTPSDAVTMFLKHVVLRGGLPFEVRLPSSRARRPGRGKPQAPIWPKGEDPLQDALDMWARAAERGREPTPVRTSPGPRP